MTAAPVERRAKIKPVRIDTLRVPAAGHAQREFKQSKGDHFAANFSLEKFGYPVVNQAGDINWLVDGQHRIYAIQKSGTAGPGNDVLCEVYEGLTDTEMAELFLGRNDATPVSAYERFLVSVTAGRPTETAIVEIVKAEKLEVRPQDQTGSVFCVGTLIRVYKRGGAELLRRTLGLLRDAYSGDSSAFASVIIDGMALMLRRYPDANSDTLIKALGKDRHGVNAIIRRAEVYRERLGRQRPQCVAAAIVDMYNESVGRKRRLTKWWRT